MVRMTPTHLEFLELPSAEEMRLLKALEAELADALRLGLLTELGAPRPENTETFVPIPGA